MASYTDKPAMQYKDVFQGISCLLGDYNIDADPTVLPVQHLWWQILSPLKDVLKEK